MKHTLKEFIERYNPNYIQIVIGGHLISIDTNVEGSYFIIKHFIDTTFILSTISNDNNLLILTI